MTAQTALPWAQLALALFNICIIVFGFYKFLTKPHNTLEGRVTALEVKQKEIEDSLKQGNDRFRTEASTIEVIQICLLALIDFELAYCVHTEYKHTEDLLKAKNILQQHLARYKGWQKEE